MSEPRKPPSGLLEPVVGDPRDILVGVFDGLFEEAECLFSYIDFRVVLSVELEADRVQQFKVAGASCSGQVVAAAQNPPTGLRKKENELWVEAARGLLHGHDQIPAVNVPGMDIAAQKGQPFRPIDKYHDTPCFLKSGAP